MSGNGAVVNSNEAGNVNSNQAGNVGMGANNSGYENPSPGLGLTAQMHYSYESYRPWGSYSGYPGAGCMPAWGGYNWGGPPIL